MKRNRSRRSVRRSITASTSSIPRPAYGFGRSEEIVGKAIAQGSLRSRVLIATKTGLEWENGKVFRNASRARILRRSTTRCAGFEPITSTSTKFTGPIPLVTIEETAEAMHTLFRQGKIRAIGVSNFSVCQMERSAASRRCMCCNRPIICSSAGSRLISCPIAAQTTSRRLAMAHSAGVCSRAGCGQILHSMVTISAAPTRSSSSPRFAQYLAAVQQLDQLAQNRFGKHVIQLAVRWMLDQGITTALWGARHPGQLEPVDEVAGWRLDAYAKSEIDRILRERSAIRSDLSSWRRQC